jgi:alcohol dehydrogenase (cytochrome c)
MTIRRMTLLWMFSAALGQWPALSLAGESDSTAPGFTATQAADGNLSYLFFCAECHGANMQGADIAPPLSGPVFMRKWAGKKMDVLFAQIQRMPPAAPGSLGTRVYTNMLAHLLRSNGALTGNTALSASAEELSRFTIGAGSPADSQVNTTSLASGNSPPLKNLRSVTPQMLTAPDADDWLVWQRTYNSHGFSPLAQINTGNVAKLEQAWRLPLPAGSSMPAPLVHDGVMFFYTYPDTVMAIDAAKGELLWRYQHESATPVSRKMGIALHGNKVLVPTSDMHVLALEARSGALIWDHAIDAPQPKGGRFGGGRYELRSSPLVAGNKLILGVTASVTPGGAFIVALNLDNGTEAWRFHTLARPGEPGGDSWNGLPVNERSGGSVWIPGSYDPQLNLVYFGAAPTYDTGPLLKKVDKAGVTNDALYTNSTLALNPDNGELVWHYQHLANDQWDLDWVFERQIMTLSIDGVERKVVINTGKMAILDALDAATGEYLFSMDMGLQNVVSAIDPKTGAKTIDPASVPNVDIPQLICPHLAGARSWPPSAYNPHSKRLYLPLTEGCMTTAKEGFKLLSSGVAISLGAHPESSDGNMGRLQVVDLQRQSLGWRHRQPAPLISSLLVTGGGLVFSGDLDPSLKAFNEATGNLLWQHPLDDNPSSNLISYGVNGKQYVAVVLGFSNNHVRDLNGVYRTTAAKNGITLPPVASGGSAILVFSLAR